MADKFPGWRYHPETGEGGLFEKVEEVPDGWLDHVQAPGSTAPPAQDVPVMSRAEIVAALDSGRIAYNAKASTTTLHTLLRDKAGAALRSRGIEFDEATPTSEMVRLLST